MTAHILVPLNGTPDAEEALFPALMLARAHQARLHLLRVVTPPPGNRHVWQMAAEIAERVSLEVAERYLCGVGWELMVAGQVPVQYSVRKGVAATSILEAAEAHGAGFIVMTTHNHGRFKRWCTGSTSGDVARASRAPVLLVPAPVEVPRPAVRWPAYA